MYFMPKIGIEFDRTSANIFNVLRYFYENQLCYFPVFENEWTVLPDVKTSIVITVLPW